VVESLLGDFSYAAILGLLALGAVGLPVPEELVQLTAGFLARGGRIDPLAAAATCYLGVLLGDCLLFQLGRRLGHRAMDLAPLARLLTPRRRRALEAHYARHAVITVMAGRYASGLRLPFFALAGACGVPWRTFLLADASAALFSVPMVVSLGWLFASALEEAQARLRLAGAGIALLALLGLGVAALLRRGRKTRPPTGGPSPVPTGATSPRGWSGRVPAGREAGAQGLGLLQQRQAGIGAPPVGEEPLHLLERLGAPAQALQRGGREEQAARVGPAAPHHGGEEE
jgi:membrane protein DedA with SNARE-associated domain